MSRAIYVIEQYITDVRKKTTVWMVFHTAYNDIYALNKEVSDGSGLLLGVLRPQYTDEQARSEFLAFIHDNFPKVALVEVGDFMPQGMLEWPYLGSIAIDADIDTDVYKALCDKYGDPYKDPVSNNAVVWLMEYNDAAEAWKNRQKGWDA